MIGKGAGLHSINECTDTRSADAAMKALFLLAICCLPTLLKQVSSRSVYLSEVETYIYNQLEGALDQGTLDNLRNAFFQAKAILFQVNITVDNVSSVNCTNDKMSFCKPNWFEVWTLCSFMEVGWTAATFNNEWLTKFIYLYGNALSFLVIYSEYLPQDILTAIRPINNIIFSDPPTISLQVNSLHCNPSKEQLANAIAELFTWVSCWN